jgi:RimJ/RimL family protein N-acetyltransferase
MGAADTDNCTHFFASLLIRDFTNITAHLLVSDLNPHLAELKTLATHHANRIVMHSNVSGQDLVQLLLEMDAVICPASSISLEACAAGCTLITGYTAENQLGILSGLDQRGAAFNLGRLQSRDEAHAADRIRTWLDDASARNVQQEQQRKLIDGLSGKRIAAALLEISEGISVRSATADDAHLYFDWANDPDVRANSYTSDPIVWENHLNWFERTSASSSHKLYIYSMANEEAAQLRLSIEDYTATISYSVGATHRGKGLGKFMLLHITLQASIDFPHLRELTGWVKKSNTASLRAFEACGYRVSEVTEESIRFSFALGQR